jgi:hypothetical protein
MLQSGRHHRSIALEGDARHLITDVWTSAGVVVGIGLVAFTGWQWLDPAVAIGVALNILREGAALMWKSSQGLMDEALSPRSWHRSKRLWKLQAPHHPLRPHLQPAIRPAPLRRPAHAHAGQLDAGPRGGGACFRGAGADERGTGAAGDDPAAAQRRGRRISTTKRT